jgi:methylaspartate ammonia-lyase
MDHRMALGPWSGQTVAQFSLSWDMFCNGMRTGVAVVADESLCSLEDGQRLAAAQAADGFNIRIAKCGGFLACLRLVKLANEAGLRCQMGTLVGETGILSRAAEIFGRESKALSSWREKAKTSVC